MAVTHAGELRDRVAFEVRGPQDDGMGNTEGDFAEQFVVAAKIEARFGGETVMAARLAGHQPKTITVRQSRDTDRINESWRARDARTDEIYNIRSKIDPDKGRGVWWELLCELGVAT